MSKGQAIAILRECEAKLRGLLQEAAKQGDYESVLEAARWAKKLSGLLDGATEPSVSCLGAKRAEPSVAEQPADPSPSKPEGGGSGAASERTTLPASSGPPSARKRRTKSHRKPKKADYPKFARRGDQLIKIGWSKKEKKEYKHKAPRRVVACLVRTLAERGKDGRIVQMGDVLPMQERDGTEIPTYQSYLALAWLRKTGLIDQHGREGYSISEPDELDQAVDASWQTLPDL